MCLSSFQSLGCITDKSKINFLTWFKFVQGEKHKWTIVFWKMRNLWGGRGEQSQVDLEVQAWTDSREIVLR